MTIIGNASYFYLCRGSIYAYKYTSFKDRLYYDEGRLEYFKRQGLDLC